MCIVFNIKILCFFGCLDNLSEFVLCAADTFAATYQNVISCF